MKEMRPLALDFYFLQMDLAAGEIATDVEIEPDDEPSSAIMAPPLLN
jgi:hypothetical protein